MYAPSQSLTPQSSQQKNVSLFCRFGFSGYGAMNAERKKDCGTSTDSIIFFFAKRAQIEIVVLFRRFEFVVSLA